MSDIERDLPPTMTFYTKLRDELRRQIGGNAAKMSVGLDLADVTSILYKGHESPFAVELPVGVIDTIDIENAKFMEGHWLGAEGCHQRIIARLTAKHKGEPVREIGSGSHEFIVVCGGERLPAIVPLYDFDAGRYDRGTELDDAQCESFLGVISAAEPFISGHNGISGLRPLAESA